jgi:hypothetical protein
MWLLACVRVVPNPANLGGPPIQMNQRLLFDSQETCFNFIAVEKIRGFQVEYIERYSKVINPSQPS